MIRMVNIMKNIVKFLEYEARIINATARVHALKKKKACPTKLGDVVGEKVLIVGNGPSVNDIDLTLLRKRRPDIEICCVNYFPSKYSKFYELKPEYLCLINPRFFMDDNDVPVENRTERKIMYDCLEKVTWDMTIVTMQSFHKKVINNSHIKILYIADNTIPYNDLFSKKILNVYKRNLANCGGQNVVIVAGFFFTLMKYKEIYIAGIDMDEYQCYRINEDNHIILRTKHFYGIREIDLVENNLWSEGSFYKLLASYQRTFEQFYYLAKFANDNNVKIYNLTLNSFVDVFSKVNIEDIINA